MCTYTIANQISVSILSLISLSELRMIAAAPIAVNEKVSACGD